MKYFLLPFLLVMSLWTFAQDAEPVKSGGFDRSRLFFGGNFGLGFGSSVTRINLSPQIGYRFNEYLAAGTGINFIHYSLKTEYSNGALYSRQSQTLAGLNIFGRFYPINQLFVQAQPELNYSWGKYKEYEPQVEYDLEGKFVPSLLLGLGGAIPAGNGAFVVMAQYDVLQDARTPYGNKIFFNFGYNFGF